MRVLLVLALLGCDRHLVGVLPPDHPGQVCIDIGYCRALAESEVEACRDQAAALHAQSVMSGCDALFDDYYQCADDHYDCQGSTPSFPGCEGDLAALQSCLQKGAAMNACGQLDQTLASCRPDAGAPAPCNLCLASCWLQNVMTPCAPSSGELQAVTQCSQSCTF